DAVLIDDTAGQGYVGANRDRFRTTGDVLVSQELGFAFAEGSELVAPFNAALESMKADGTLAEINAKWFGAESPANALNEAEAEAEEASEEAEATAEATEVSVIEEAAAAVEEAAEEVIAEATEVAAAVEEVSEEVI